MLDVSGMLVFLSVCSFVRFPVTLCYYVHNSFGVLMPTHCLLKIIYSVVNYSNALLEIPLVRHQVRFVLNVLIKDGNCYQR